jgi:hypothetical protein
MAQDMLSLIWEARRLVGFTNRAFANVTGVALRTVERHAQNGGVASSTQVERLVAAVHPHNPTLADALAKGIGTSLDALGLAAAPSASDARPEHADSVLGVDVKGLVEHLSRPAPTGKPKAASKG